MGAPPDRRHHAPQSPPPGEGSASSTSFQLTRARAKIYDQGKHIAELSGELGVTRREKNVANALLVQAQRRITHLTHEKDEVAARAAALEEGLDTASQDVTEARRSLRTIENLQARIATAALVVFPQFKVIWPEIVDYVPPLNEGTINDLLIASEGNLERLSYLSALHYAKELQHHIDLSETSSETINENERRRLIEYVSIMKKMLSVYRDEHQLAALTAKPANAPLDTPPALVSEARVEPVQETTSPPSLTDRAAKIRSSTEFFPADLISPTIDASIGAVAGEGNVEALMTLGLTEADIMKMAEEGIAAIEAYWQEQEVIQKARSRTRGKRSTSLVRKETTDRIAAVASTEPITIVTLPTVTQTQTDAATTDSPPIPKKWYKLGLVTPLTQRERACAEALANGKTDKVQANYHLTQAEIERIVHHAIDTKYLPTLEPGYVAPGLASRQMPIDARPLAYPNGSDASVERGRERPSWYGNLNALQQVFLDAVLTENFEGLRESGYSESRVISVVSKLYREYD